MQQYSPSRQLLSQYNIKKHSTRHRLTQSIGFKQSVTTLQIYEDTLYVGTDQSKVIVYELVQNENADLPVSLSYSTKIYPYCTQPYCIVASQSHLILVPKKQEQVIRIWNRDTLKLMHGYRGHKKQISQVIFLKNGQQIASSSHDATVRIWNINEHNQFEKQVHKYEGEYPLLAVEQISENTLALGGDSCFITLWNWKRQEVQCKVFGHPGSVLSISLYNPYLISSGGDSKIKLWQIKQELQLEEQTTNELILRKELSGKLTQYQYFCRVSLYQILIIDSNGDVFLMNAKLEMKRFKIELDVSKRILSVKLWRNYLLYFKNYEKKEKRFLNVFAFNQEDFDQYADTLALANQLQLKLVKSLLEHPKSLKKISGE